MINYFIVRDPSDSDDDDDYYYCDGRSPDIADLGNKNGLPESVTYMYNTADVYLYIYIILMRIPRRTPRQRENSRRYQILPGDPLPRRYAAASPPQT